MTQRAYSLEKTGGGKDWRQKEEGVAEGEIDGYTASQTRWTWVWANSRRQWRAEEPGILQPMGSQRVEHDLATEQEQQQKLSDSASQWEDIRMYPGCGRGLVWILASKHCNTSKFRLVFFPIFIFVSAFSGSNKLGSQFPQTMYVFQ